jgi:hypothetical protein
MSSVTKRTTNKGQKEITIKIEGEPLQKSASTRKRKSVTSSKPNNLIILDNDDEKEPIDVPTKISKKRSRKFSHPAMPLTGM